MPKTINDMTMPMMIISVVFDYFGIQSNLRTANVRNREVVVAKQISMFYIRKYTRQSYAGIGNYFFRDHATVMYAIKTINNLMCYDRHFREDIKHIETRIFSRIVIDEHRYDQYNTDNV